MPIQRIQCEFCAKLISIKNKSKHLLVVHGIKFERKESLMCDGCLCHFSPKYIFSHQKSCLIFLKGMKSGDKKKFKKKDEGRKNVVDKLQNKKFKKIEKKAKRKKFSRAKEEYFVINEDKFWLKNINIAGKSNIELVSLLCCCDFESINFASSLKKLVKKTTQKEDIISVKKKCELCHNERFENSREIEKQFYECFSCLGKYHEECLVNFKIKSCFCESLSLENVGELIECPEALFQKNLCFQTLEPMLPTLLTTKEQMMKSEVRVKHYICSQNLEYCRSSVYHSNISKSINLMNEPWLTKASPKLEKLYNDFYSSAYFPDVKIDYLGENVGVGVMAASKISKNSFLFEYGGNILPGTFGKLNEKSTMILMEADLAENSLIVTVLTHCSIGPLLNHSENPNCRTIRLVVKGFPRILFYAFKEISEGDQLTYNYNGAQSFYDTSSFLNL